MGQIRAGAGYFRIGIYFVHADWKCILIFAGVNIASVASASESSWF